MLDLPGPMFFDEGMADPNVLLIHGVGAALEFAVSVILVRALYVFRRNAEAPRAFTSIAILMLLASLARIVRVSLAWVTGTPLFWLDAMTVTLLLVVVIYIPIVLSARYFPIEASASTSLIRWHWLQWAMIGNAVCGIVTFAFAAAIRSIPLIALVPCGMCGTSAVLLGIRASLFRASQLRQRPLFLFASLTTMGLLGIAVTLIYGYLGGTSRIIDAKTDAAWIELCNTLIVLGLISAFASVRLADIIVKRVTHLYIWAAVALLLWGSVRSPNSFAADTIHQKASLSLFSVVIIAITLALTPIVIRKIDGWIDAWMFQVPDFDAASEQFWKELLELGSGEEVYRAGETMVRKTLSLAAVRIMRVSELQSAGEVIRILGPNPYFVETGSPVRSIIFPPADVLIPLFSEGVAEHWIVLSHGTIRPPLTAAELSFISRIASAIQVRISTVLGEQTRLERLKRESTLKEEIADAELRALRAQINPHFLFNSLNTIADLSVVSPKKAEEMTLRLAAVFRYVLANTDRHFTSVKEEIEFARTYLDLEEARFEHRLKVRFEVDPTMLQEEVPTLLLQPLIENALKHGLGPKREGGTLTVIGRRTFAGFELVVSDDGVGLRATRQESREPSTRVGLRNIQSRLHTAYGGRAKLILSPRAGGGTEATIVIHRDKENLV